MGELPLEQQKLVAGCQGLVRSLAWKIHCKLPRSVDLEDLISYGQLGLVEAAREFDITRGGQFTTYAYYRIRGAILDGLSKMAWFNRRDYHAGRYEKLANDVLDTEAELGHSGDNHVDDDLGWFGRVTNGLAVVYLLSQAPHASADESAGLEDRVLEDSASASPAAVAAQRELAHKLQAMISALPGDAASLIRSAYFEGMSLKEAGERLGISKSWASRLHNRALGELARSLATAGFHD